ncbi:Protein of unknown function [Pyronema omphalodes CBS 100304]|uniref:Uncharacterized protein n=1 Tax=Pyronema omphalodes (strain CBS 100304) TaxID=1076935 RepID=U4L334_PYROM|nr:Protein of unknown function [Pyronema omphalodes CBS 100304]
MRAERRDASRTLRCLRMSSAPSTPPCGFYIRYNPQCFSLSANNAQPLTVRVQFIAQHSQLFGNVARQTQSSSVFGFMIRLYCTFNHSASISTLPLYGPQR